MVPVVRPVRAEVAAHQSTITLLKTPLPAFPAFPHSLPLPSVHTEGTIAAVARRQVPQPTRSRRRPDRRSFGEFFFGGSKHRRPTAPIPVESRVAADYRDAARERTARHLARPLDDAPRGRWAARAVRSGVGERASFVSFAGPKRFYPAAASVRRAAVGRRRRALARSLRSSRLATFVASVAARGVALDRPARRRRLAVAVGRSRRSDVTELDWWDSTRVGALTLTATPARHFSGRGLLERDTTLWCGLGRWSASGIASTTPATPRSRTSSSRSADDSVRSISR